MDKLIRAGGGWLAGHPERELITRRYLGAPARAGRDRRRLGWPRWTTPSRRQLDNAVTASETRRGAPPAGPAAARAVLAALRAAGAARSSTSAAARARCCASCSRDPAFSEVVGVDVSPGRWRSPRAGCSLDRMPDGQRDRLRADPVVGDLPRRPAAPGYDAVVLMEVIEHVDPARLPALERHGVRRTPAPTRCVVTTPNVEHNVRYEGLPAGTMRHRDHRFEWTRAEFSDWAGPVCGRPSATTSRFAAGRRGRPGASGHRPSWRSSRQRCEASAARPRERSAIPELSPGRAWSVRPARASPPSPASTSAASR